MEPFWSQRPIQTAVPESSTRVDGGDHRVTVILRSRWDVAGFPAFSSAQLAQAFQRGVRTPGDAARLSHSPRFVQRLEPQRESDSPACGRTRRILPKYSRPECQSVRLRLFPSASFPSRLFVLIPGQPRLPDVECAGSACYRHTDTGGFGTMRLWIYFFSITVLLCLREAAFGQATGTIDGSVYDPSGALVPGRRRHRDKSGYKSVTAGGGGRHGQVHFHVPSRRHATP